MNIRVINERWDANGRARWEISVILEFGRAGVLTMRKIEMDTVFQYFVHPIQCNPVQFDPVMNNELQKVSSAFS